MIYQKSIENSFATDADIQIPKPVSQKFDYFAYQKAGIAYAQDREGVLIADEMGLGKTIQAIGIANLMAARSVLIITPAALKYNWEKELSNWLVGDLKIGVLTSKRFPENRDVWVINYDILHKYRNEIRQKEWDLLVCDESHNLKNQDANRTREVVGGNVSTPKLDKDGNKQYTKTGRVKKTRTKIDGITAKKKVFLTGTPVLNKPSELWTTVNYLAPQVFRDQWTFWNTFCDYKRDRFNRVDVSGSSNLDLLQNTLRTHIMVRRMKRQVLKDLPPKMRQVIEVDPNEIGLKPAELKELKIANSKYDLWSESNKHLRQSLRDISDTAKRTGDLEEYTREVGKLKEANRMAFYEMASIRKETALAKIPLMIRHTEATLENVDKLIVFVHHHEVANALYDHFPNSVRITGQVSDVNKQKAQEDFQNNPDVNLIVMTIRAGGVGFTLTAASNVIFFEFDWVPAMLLQAEDRAHRIGQVNPVLIQHIVLAGSIDAKMINRLVAKQNMIDQVLDDREREVLSTIAETI